MKLLRDSTSACMKKPSKTHVSQQTCFARRARYPTGLPTGHWAEHFTVHPQTVRIHHENLPAVQRFLLPAKPSDYNFGTGRFATFFSMRALSSCAGRGTLLLLLFPAPRGAGGARSVKDSSHFQPIGTESSCCASNAHGCLCARWRPPSEVR